MTTASILLWVLATAALATDAIKPPPDDDWYTTPSFTFPPGFTIPTFTHPTTPTFTRITTPTFKRPATPTYTPFTFPPGSTIPTFTHPTTPTSTRVTTPTSTHPTTPTNPTLTLPTRKTFPTFTFPTKPRPTSESPIGTSIPPQRCRDIRTRQECIANRPCPEGPNNESFCRWIPLYFKLPLDRPIGKMRTDLYKLKNHKNTLEKRQVSLSDDFPLLPQPPPYPIVPFNRGFCTCCSITSCDPPKEYNHAFCRCECPKDTIENAQGECVGDCGNIQDLDLCPKIYCADNSHFRCKQDDYKCACPSCDAATERSLCVHTQCLEQPRKAACVFDSKTQNCRCPTCEDQNGDRLWCLTTYCGLNNSLQCKWEADLKECSCPAQSSNR